jgi:phosphoserine aminotransferase
MKPSIRPNNPRFSSGPCSKRPGYDVSKLNLSILGRSHRAPIGSDFLAYAIDLTHQVLQLPEDYLVGIVPASDTGAVEIALWSVLGARPVDVLAWESFGLGWVTDIETQLQLKNVRTLTAPYGQLPDLTQVNFDHDVVFTWNGTTSGVKVPNGDWIDDNRTGLTICDATSATFAMPIPWPKIDIGTYSWQKVLGGEGAHGILVLSPRAVARLESYTPPWPMPKLFRLTDNGQLQRSIFRGSTINTPSMLCVADYVDALEWAQEMGGLPALIARSNQNLSVIADFVAQREWLHFLAQEPEQRSNTSVCLTLDLTPKQVKRMVQLLESEAVAFDIKSYRDAPEGLRIWCGATVESADLEALCPWLDWAYGQVQQFNE